MNLNDTTLNINLSHRSALGICIAMAALVFFTLAYAAWQWQADWLLTHHTDLAIPNLGNSKQTSDIVAAIPEEHFFGTSKSKLGNMPITNLQLRVTGIVK